MKHVIQLAFLIFLASIMACEAPRNARSRKGGSSADALSASSDYRNNDSSNTGDITIDDSGSGSDTGSGTNPSIPSEISHCQWSTDGVSGFQSTSSHLGDYTLCQSSIDEKDVYLQVKAPITDSQLCLIPTFNNGTSSIYIGEPRCLSVVNNRKIYKIGLVKNRSGFTNFSISGAMVMKDKAFFYPPPFYQYVLSPDAYIFCSQYLDEYGDSRYCQSFQSVNQFKYHQF